MPTDPDLVWNARRLSAARRASLLNTAVIEGDLGPVLAALHNQGSSLSSLGRLVGGSHILARSLMDRSRVDPGAAEGWTVPLLSTTEAVKLATSYGLRRAIAGFDAADVFHHSRLAPAVFASGQGSTLVVPHMLWELNVDGDERWLGVLGVTIGYNGTGPGNALNALVQAGVDATVARTVAYGCQFADVDVTTQRLAFAMPAGSPYQMQRPTKVGDVFAFLAGRDPDAVEGIVNPRRRGLGLAPETSEIGALAKHFALDPSERAPWIGDWADRHARLYLDPAAARASGFCRTVAMGPMGPPMTYQLIIEQGQAHIWVPLYQPDDGRLLGDEAYETLAQFDLVPTDIRHHDVRSQARRWLAQLWTGRRRPPWIDISPMGDRHLEHLPHPQPPSLDVVATGARVARTTV